MICFSRYILTTYMYSYNFYICVYSFLEQIFVFKSEKKFKNNRKNVKKKKKCDLSGKFRDVSKPDGREGGWQMVAAAMAQPLFMGSTLYPVSPIIQMFFMHILTLTVHLPLLTNPPFKGCKLPAWSRWMNSYKNIWCLNCDAAAIVDLKVFKQL